MTLYAIRSRPDPRRSKTPRPSMNCRYGWKSSNQTMCCARLVDRSAQMRLAAIRERASNAPGDPTQFAGDDSPR